MSVEGKFLLLGNIERQRLWRQRLSAYPWAGLGLSRAKGLLTQAGYLGVQPLGGFFVYFWPLKNRPLAERPRQTGKSVPEIVEKND